MLLKLLCHRPDLIPYENLTKSTAPENLQTAFDVAERELNIFRLLDASGRLLSFAANDIYGCFDTVCVVPINLCLICCFCHLNCSIVDFSMCCILVFYFIC